MAQGYHYSGRRCCIEGSPKSQRALLRRCKIQHHLLSHMQAQYVMPLEYITDGLYNQEGPQGHTSHHAKVCLQATRGW